MSGELMYGKNIWRQACRKSCMPDRSFDSLYTGSGVEWMTCAISRGCAKCHLLADTITGFLIMSQNERFQFQHLHIPHQQYLQTHVFDSLRMRIGYRIALILGGFFPNTRAIQNTNLKSFFLFFYCEITCAI